MTIEPIVAEPGDTIVVAGEAAAPVLTPVEMELERTAIVEEETTKRELARLTTELEIAKLQLEKPPWLEELIMRLETKLAEISQLCSQTPLMPPPAPTAIAIAAPEEAEATGEGATVIAEPLPEDAASGVMPEVAAPEPERKRTFSRGI
jgi:hypothetical protein